MLIAKLQNFKFQVDYSQSNKNIYVGNLNKFRAKHTILVKKKFIKSKNSLKSVPIMELWNTTVTVQVLNTFFKLLKVGFSSL